MVFLKKIHGPVLELWFSVRMLYFQFSEQQKANTTQNNSTFRVMEVFLLEDVYKDLETLF